MHARWLEGGYLWLRVGVFLYFLLLSNWKNVSNGRHCSFGNLQSKMKKKKFREHIRQRVWLLSGRSLLSSLVSDQKSMLENGLTTASQWQCEGAGCVEASGSGQWGCFIWMTKGKTHRPIILRGTVSANWPPRWVVCWGGAVSINNLLSLPQVAFLPVLPTALQRAPNLVL